MFNWFLVHASFTTNLLDANLSIGIIVHSIINVGYCNHLVKLLCFGLSLSRQFSFRSRHFRLNQYFLVQFCFRNTMPLLLLWTKCFLFCCVKKTTVTFFIAECNSDNVIHYYFKFLVCKNEITAIHCHCRKWNRLCSDFLKEPNGK